MAGFLCKAKTSKYNEKLNTYIKLVYTRDRIKVNVITIDLLLRVIRDEPNPREVAPPYKRFM